MEGNHAFVTLMRAAQEDQDLKNKLVSILSLDEANRKSVLNTFIQELRLRKAPTSIIDSLSIFLDNNAAQKALDLLTRTS